MPRLKASDARVVRYRRRIGNLALAPSRGVGELTATYQRWFDAIRRLLPSRQYPQSPSLYGAAGVKRERVLA